MTQSMLTTPAGCNLPLIYYRKHPNLAELDYLNWKRAGLLASFPNAKIRYDNTLQYHVRCFAQEFIKNGIEFDGIVSASSTTNDSEPYRTALMKPGVTDFTSSFRRIGNVKSGHSTTLQELIVDSVYVANGKESEMHSLLIVDEIIHSGMTIDATIYHLRKAGLPLGCAITAVTPAWIEKQLHGSALLSNTAHPQNSE